MPGPGYEPGLLRPQRSVLATRRSRLTIPPTAGERQKNISLCSNNQMRILYGDFSILSIVSTQIM